MTLKRLSVWVLAALLSLEFCLAGLAKFGASSDWPRMFLQWGFPAWCRPVVGAAEVVCGLALLVPRARKWACLALLCIMVGATATRLVHGEPRGMILPVVLSALVGLLGWFSVTAHRA
jgi:putative oxidoreductase